MNPAIALALRGPALELRIDDPAPAAALRLRRRDGGAGFQVPLHPAGGGALACIPLEALATGGLPRWDVRQVGSDGAEAPLCPQPPSVPARHFFNDSHGELGVSAYLSDTLGSLVLMTGPIGGHRWTTQAEDARAAFPRWLEELPLEPDVVLFESFLGKAYAGNPRHIYETLRRLRPDLHCVWAYNGTGPIPGNPRRVHRGSAEYYRVLATAGYRVNNIRFPVAGRKPQTAYLQTWHGTPLKRLGHDIEVAGPEADARASFDQESRGWTCLLSANPFSSQTLRRAFRYDGPVLEAGYPLVDMLSGPDPDRDALAAQLGLPAGHRFVLYAPTWRDHRPVGHWKFDLDLQLDLDAVSTALEPDQILLLRAHHLVAAGLDPDALPANVRDVSHVDDVSALCALAEVLVTDYSSVFFDFAVTGRPILFYCYDLEQYAGQVRGFYLDVERDLPGPVARTTQELIGLLRSLPDVQARHAARYAAFRRRFCPLADGGAARRVVESFFGPASAVPLVRDLQALGTGLDADAGERLRDLLTRYAAHARSISSLLYERLPGPDRHRFLLWFLKRWAAIERVDPGEMAAYRETEARVRGEVREPVVVDGRCYTLQDMCSQGYDFRLATYDWMLGIHDVFYDQYQADGFRVQPGDVIIDAGGFVGDTAILFCAKTGNDCQVHAFEVLEENLALFRHNIARNGVQRQVVLNALALASRSGQELVIREAPLQGATSVGGGGEDGVRVPTITLDDYVARAGLERVDLVKMDIEGSELAALEGAAGTLRRFRPKLALCLYHRWDDVLAIPRFLDQLGVDYRYRFKWVELANGWEAVLLASPADDAPSREATWH